MGIRVALLQQNNARKEVNRIMTDHLSALLFCPSSSSVQNLSQEGITQGVYCVGDIMFDAVKP